MAYHYSDPSRESDPHALPDVETFQTDEDGYLDGKPFVLPHKPGGTAYGVRLGWFYVFVTPLESWDSEPVGPYDSETEALAAAREES